MLIRIFKCGLFQIIRWNVAPVMIIHMAEYSATDNNTQQWGTVECLASLFIYYMVPLAILFYSI